MARSHRVVSLRFGTDKRSQELARQVLEVLRDEDGEEGNEEVGADAEESKKEGKEGEQTGGK